MTVAECIDAARLALLRAENIEAHHETRAQAGASNHARGFCNSSRLRRIRAAINELGQIDNSDVKQGEAS